MPKSGPILAVLGMFLVSATAQTPSKPLTLEKFDKIIQAGNVDADQLAREIYSSGVDFRLTSDAEARLIARGVAVKVLLAISLNGKAVPSKPTVPDPSLYPDSKLKTNLTFISQPRVLSSPGPRYPSAALRDGIQGVVPVDVIIAADGQVVYAQAVGGDEALMPAAESAVLAWKFAPSLIDGKPRDVTTRVLITFKLPARGQ